MLVPTVSSFAGKVMVFFVPFSGSVVIEISISSWLWCSSHCFLVCSSAAIHVNMQMGGRTQELPASHRLPRLTVPHRCSNQLSSHHNLAVEHFSDPSADLWCWDNAAKGI